MRMLKQKNNGFTLIELIIVLALLATTIAAIFAFFSFTRDSFRRTDIQSQLIHEMNLAVSQMSNDIRSASKPNAATNSVVVKNASGTLAKGQSMDIYSYESSSGKYIRICYRLDPSDKTVLQRGEAVCTTALPASNANPNYANITSWKNIMSGVIYKGESGVQVAIFEDNTSSDDDERRKIRLKMGINNTIEPLPKPVETDMTVTSRSEGVPE